MSTATIGHNAPPPLKEILAENYAHLQREVEELAKRAYLAPKTVKTDEELDAIGVLVKDARAVAKRVDTARKAEKEPHLQAGRDVDGFFKAIEERLNSMATRLGDRATEYQRAKAAEARRKAEEEARKLREKEEAERRKAEEAAAKGRERTADKAEFKADTLADKAAEAERQAESTAADLTRTRGASGTLATAKTETKIKIVDLKAVDLEAIRPYLHSDVIQKAANAWLKFNPGQPAPSGFEVYEDVKAVFR